MRQGKQPLMDNEKVSFSAMCPLPDGLWAVNRKKRWCDVKAMIKQLAQESVTIKTTVAMTGAAASYIFGGWSTGLIVLGILVCIDFVTGLLAGFYEKKLSSQIGSKGILRKFGMIWVIAMCHLLDVLLGTENLLRDGAVFFYAANECLSITENAGRMGLQLPGPIEKAIQVLQEKTDKKQ
ncbi:phage holin family protein [Laceyella sediminis]|jgi:toxin secretion/phage lysis holin|uniref:phage holin family protein n=1 Tax=Laceyella sediminis TaxID=573074 RepID=UPI001FEB3A81|nr:phage holin family protein [Laceyella sediminis]